MIPQLESTQHSLFPKMNAITSFVDASAVYGSNRFTARRLRTRKNGLMKVKEKTKEVRECLSIQKSPF